MQDARILLLSLLAVLVAVSRCAPLNFPNTRFELLYPREDVSQQNEAPPGEDDEKEQANFSLSSTTSALQRLGVELGVLSGVGNDGANQSILEESLGRTTNAAQLIEVTARVLRDEYTNYISKNWISDLRVLDELPLMILAQLSPASPLSMVGCPRGMVPYNLTHCTHGILAEANIRGRCPNPDTFFSKSLLSCAVWTRVEAQLECPSGYKIAAAPIAKLAGPCVADTIKGATRTCDKPYTYDPKAASCVLREYTSGYVGCRLGETLVGSICMAAYQERPEISCSDGATFRYLPDGAPQCYVTKEVKGRWNSWTQRPSCPEGYTSTITKEPLMKALGNGTDPYPYDRVHAEPLVKCTRITVLPPTAVTIKCPNGTLPLQMYLERQKNSQPHLPKPHLDAGNGDARWSCIRLKQFPVTPACPLKEQQLWVRGAEAIVRQAMLKRAVRSAGLAVSALTTTAPLSSSANSSVPANSSSQSAGSPTARSLQSLYSAPGPWASPMSYAVPGVFAFPWDFTSAQMIDTNLAMQSNVPTPGGNSPFGQDRFGGNRYGNRGYGYEPAAVDAFIDQADMGLGDYYGAGRYEASNWIPGAAGFSRSNVKIAADDAAYAQTTGQWNSHTVPLGGIGHRSPRRHHSSRGPPSADRPSNFRGWLPSMQRPLHHAETAEEAYWQQMLNASGGGDLTSFDELWENVKQKEPSVGPPKPQNAPIISPKEDELTDPVSLLDHLESEFELPDWEVDWVTAFLTGDLEVVCESSVHARPYLTCPYGSRLRPDGTCKGIGYVDFELVCPDGFALDQSTLGESKKGARKPMCAGLVPGATDYYCPSILSVGSQDGTDLLQKNDTFFTNLTKATGGTATASTASMAAPAGSRELSHTGTGRSLNTLQGAIKNRLLATRRGLGAPAGSPAGSPVSQSFDFAVVALVREAAAYLDRSTYSDSGSKYVGALLTHFPPASRQSRSLAELDAAFGLLLLQSFVMDSRSPAAEDLDAIRSLSAFAGWEPTLSAGPTVVTDGALRLCYEVADLAPAWYTPNRAAILSLYGPEIGAQLILKVQDATQRATGASPIYPLLPIPPRPKLELEDVLRGPAQDARPPLSTEERACIQGQVARGFLKYYRETLSADTSVKLNYTELRTASDAVGFTVLPALVKRQPGTLRAKSTLIIEDAVLQEIDRVAKWVNACTPEAVDSRANDDSGENAAVKPPLFDEQLKHYDVIMTSPQLSVPAPRLEPLQSFAAKKGTSSKKPD